MLESIPFLILLSTVLGFLAGIGIGGGSLLILWLTAVLDMDPDAARSINLLFFVPSAAIASLFRWSQGTLKPRTILPAVIAGCLSAGVFSLLGDRLDTNLLKKLFGILLLVTGTRELLWKEKQKS